MHPVYNDLYQNHCACLSGPWKESTVHALFVIGLVLILTGSLALLAHGLLGIVIATLIMSAGGVFFFLSSYIMVLFRRYTPHLQPAGAY